MSKKILLTINSAAFFVSHRLPIAKAAVEDGWEVSVVTGQPPSSAMDEGAEEAISTAGIQYRQLQFRAAGTNPVFELIGLVQMFFHVVMFRPDVMHCITPKGNLYGGLCARFLRVPKLVLAISGMGYLYTDGGGFFKRLIKSIYRPLIRWIYRHPQITVIVQNQDDYNSILSAGWVPQERIVLIPGSGVVLDDYVQLSDTDHIQPLVILPARLILEKGIQEFVEAAINCKATYPQWRFALVGTADYQSPSAISRPQIEQWVDAGSIEWFGYQHDMPAVYRQCAIVCLPSFYMEGLPKCLLEAAAAGRPVVTTNSVGCREAIIDGETGILVPVRDAEALAQALLRLMNDPALRERMGAAGRERAIREFDINTVVARHLAIYAS